MRGKFITIEGPDGAGKTTQIKKLSRYLENKGHKVLVTREPGGTPLGEELRRLLLSPGKDSPVPKAEALIYAASRAQLMATVIEPALEAGITVLSDRFVDSSLAYQGYARGLGVEEILKINEFFLKGRFPDITLLLDIDPEQSLARRSGTKDRLEMEALSFHHKVREGFHEVAKKFPHRIKTVEATGDEDAVFAAILLEIKKSGIIELQ
jgi:dTMP kinase